MIIEQKKMLLGSTLLLTGAILLISGCGQKKSDAEKMKSQTARTAAAGPERVNYSTCGKRMEPKSRSACVTQLAIQEKKVFYCNMLPTKESAAGCINAFAAGQPIPLKDCDTMVANYKDLCLAKVKNN